MTDVLGRNTWCCVICVLSFLLIILIILILYFCKDIILNHCVNALFGGMKTAEHMTPPVELTSKEQIRKFYNEAPTSGRYIKYITSACDQTYEFIKRKPLLNLVSKTIVFDVDDTLLYSKSKSKYLKPLEPVAKLLNNAKKLGYIIVIITARPPSSLELTVENLKKINVHPDAIFTSLYWGQPDFKHVMRKNLEYIDRDVLKTITSEELLNIDKPLKLPMDLKLVLTVGDQWQDVENMKNVLGLKLPEPSDMNSYFVFNENIRIIE